MDFPERKSFVSEYDHAVIEEYNCSVMDSLCDESTNESSSSKSSIENLDDLKLCEDLCGPGIWKSKLRLIMVTFARTQNARELMVFLVKCEGLPKYILNHFQKLLKGFNLTSDDAKLTNNQYRATYQQLEQFSNSHSSNTKGQNVGLFGIHHKSPQPNIYYYKPTTEPWMVCNGLDSATTSFKKSPEFLQDVWRNLLNTISSFGSLSSSLNMVFLDYLDIISQILDTTPEAMGCHLAIMDLLYENGWSKSGCGGFDSEPNSKALILGLEKIFG